MPAACLEKDAVSSSQRKEIYVIDLFLLFMAPGVFRKNLSLILPALKWISKETGDIRSYKIHLQGVKSTTFRIRHTLPLPSTSRVTLSKLLYLSGSQCPYL